MIMEAPHTAASGMWSYSCKCIRCRWEQWWHEGDNSVIPIPDAPHPDGEYVTFWRDRNRWSGATHPNETGTQA